MILDSQGKVKSQCERVFATNKIFLFLWKIIEKKNFIKLNTKKKNLKKFLRTVIYVPRTTNRLRGHEMVQGAGTAPKLQQIWFHGRSLGNCLYYG